MTDRSRRWRLFLTATLATALAGADEPRFSRPDPAAALGEYKVYTQPGDPLRPVVEDWEGARRRAADAFERRGDRFGIIAALGAQHDAPAAPLEQRHLQPAFEMRDMPADRALRQPHFLARGGEIAVPRGGGKAMQRGHRRQQAARGVIHSVCSYEHAPLSFCGTTEIEEVKSLRPEA